jgi:DNA mismatch endonuclease, patch repair protein
MTDRISKKHRSWNMSRIKGKNTKPERVVRSLLHRMGCRFRLHRKDLPGKPDIVLPRYRTVVFVHGCFWHRHPRCRFAYTPKSRVAFWEKKFAENTARDRRNRRELRKHGWRVIVVWECEIRDMAKLRRKLSRKLGKAPPE